jgi:hypothetical protein
MNKYYSIILEDTGKTHNINMHTYDCYASSKEEAIGKMWFARPDFRNVKVDKIMEEGNDVYVDLDYQKSIENALEILRQRNLKNIVG